MQVSLCKSGDSALKALKRNRYDIIFMDGMETASCIRKMGADAPYFADVPIVALTANAISGMKEGFLENGFSGFTSKPVNMVDAIMRVRVRRRISRCVQRRRKRYFQRFCAKY